MTCKEFAEYVRKERIRQGITQAELAEISGFTREFISCLENGRQSISLKNADRLLSALGKTMIIIEEGKHNGKGN